MVFDELVALQAEVVHADELAQAVNLVLADLSFVLKSKSPKVVQGGS